MLPLLPVVLLVGVPVPDAVVADVLPVVVEPAALPEVLPVVLAASLDCVPPPAIAVAKAVMCVRNSVNCVRVASSTAPAVLLFAVLPLVPAVPLVEPEAEPVVEPAVEPELEPVDPVEAAPAEEADACPIREVSTLSMAATSVPQFAVPRFAVARLLRFA